MLASPLTQFGIKLINGLTVPITFGDEHLDFGVRVYECDAGDGRCLRHAELVHPDSFSPDATNSDDETSDDAFPDDAGPNGTAESAKHSISSRFWLRVMIHYQKAVEHASDSNRISGDRALIRRTQLLGHIAIAFPQRQSALECRTISNRDVLSTGHRPIDPNSTLSRVSGAGGPHPTAKPAEVLKASCDDLTRFAAGYLYPELPSEDWISNYMEFEKTIIQKMADLLNEYSAPGNWKIAHKEIKAELVRIRKKATDDRRIQLNLLRAACDNALSDMYQYAARAVLRDIEVGEILGSESLVCNRFTHGAQDPLGGIVPAIYPLWPICLKTPWIVRTLLDHAAATESESAINRLNLAMVETVRIYVDLFKTSSEGDFVYLDSPLSQEDGRTLHDVISSSEPGIRVERTEIMSAFWDAADVLKDDRDVQVAKAICSEGISGIIAAERFSCSEGQISKCKTRGLTKLRNALTKKGMTTEDVLQSFVPERFTMRLQQYGSGSHNHPESD